MKYLISISFVILLFCLFSMNCFAKNFTLASLSYPPYGYLDGDEAKGLDVEIITEAFRRMGDSVTFKFVPWKRALAMARYDQVDGLFLLLKTPEREKYMYYSEPMRMEAMALFVRKGSDIEFNGDFNVLCGRKFGVINNFSYGPELDLFINKNKSKNVEVGESPLMNICKLIKRRFDIFIADDLSTLYIAREAGLDGKIDRLELLVGKNPICVSFLKCRNLEKDRDRFNVALRSMRSDGTLKKLVQKYRDQKDEMFPGKKTSLDCY